MVCAVVVFDVRVQKSVELIRLKVLQAGLVCGSQFEVDFDVCIPERIMLPETVVCLGRSNSPTMLPPGLHLVAYYYFRFQNWYYKSVFLAVRNPFNIHNLTKAFLRLTMTQNQQVMGSCVCDGVYESNSRLSKSVKDNNAYVPQNTDDIYC